ncbi:hypothetical protein [Methylorubrum thiocyanatum]|uniref:hypothetical protein n=1 Tax=Methylorubrum thiocyanatum TaxID=47958 RepID=UPI00398C3246
MRPAKALGVAFRASGPSRRNMHVGILYALPGKAVHMAHLANHNDCRDEPAPNDSGYVWADCAWLAGPGMDDAATVASEYVAFCAKRKRIPYSPRAPKKPFTADGRFISHDPREGLTCATYIEAVFRGAGYPVVLLLTWQPRPDDAEWWDSLRPNLGPERSAELADIEIEYRLKPNEVAVAAAAPDTPLDFTAAVERSSALSAMFD